MKKGPAGPFFYPTAGNSPATMQNWIATMPIPHSRTSHSAGAPPATRQAACGCSRRLFMTSMAGHIRARTANATPA